MIKNHQRNKHSGEKQTNKQTEDQRFVWLKERNFGLKWSLVISARTGMGLHLAPGSDWLFTLNGPGLLPGPGPDWTRDLCFLWAAKHLSPLGLNYDHFFFIFTNIYFHIINQSINPSINQLLFF